MFPNYFTSVAACKESKNSPLLALFFQMFPSLLLLQTPARAPTALQDILHEHAHPNCTPYQGRCWLGWCPEPGALWHAALSSQHCTLKLLHPQSVISPSSESPYLYVSRDGISALNITPVLPPPLSYMHSAEVKACFQASCWALSPLIPLTTR